MQHRFFLELKQQQRLSPQQIQLIKLMELPAQELEQRIRREIENNPALEESPTEETDEKTELTTNFEELEYEPRYRSLSHSLSPPSSFLSAIPDHNGTLQSFLQPQLSLFKLTEHQQHLCTYLIGCLDLDGYLRRPLPNIVNDILFSQSVETNEAELSELLFLIQDLEPAGVGARDLQECLLLQLERKEHKLKKNKNIPLARKIIAQTFEDFSHKRYARIMEQLDVKKPAIKRAIAEIIKLNPKPGSAFDDTETGFAPAIFPDFVVEYKNGELTHSLMVRQTPNLQVSKDYKEMLQLFSKKNTVQEKEAKQFTKRKIDDARWFIKSVRQRQKTLASVMNAIISKQRDFFITGDVDMLQPLGLKTIAEQTNFDVSTISRVINNKYVQTNFGVFPLKYFFSEGTTNKEGTEISTRQVKMALANIVDAENKRKPLSDEDLVRRLRQQGFIVARRTVAKYREQMEIAVARMRKKI